MNVSLEIDWRIDPEIFDISGNMAHTGSGFYDPLRPSGYADLC
jgi:hypothetical protein